MIAKQFFDEWSTYEKVVANDYMHHRDFFATLAERIASEFDRPLKIIDLGCGDAQPVAPLLQRFQIEKYVGIDQSASAIDRATRLLSSLTVPFQVHCMTMMAALGMLETRFDIALASYSLHHFDQNGKLAVLKECRRLLKPGGLLAIVDVFLEDGESRDDYARRWERNARAAFTALTPDETGEILRHMHTSDLPETVADYRRLATTAGFSSTTALKQDAERLNRLVMIS